MSVAEKFLMLDELKRALTYNESTGIFTWNITVGRASAGSRAGCPSAPGRYRQIRLSRRQYLEHRLAWFYIYGKWPSVAIDHINGDKSDNRLANLREATLSENQHNRGCPITNTSGFKGVSWCRRTKLWHAAIKVSRRSINLGYFDRPEDAAKTYEAAALKYHGEFARMA